MSAAVLTAMVSCGGKEPEPPKVFEVNQMSDSAYKKSLMELPESLGVIYHAEPYNSGKNYMILSSGIGNKAAYSSSNADLTEFETLDIPEINTGYSYDLAAAENGNIVRFVIHADFGDDSITVFSEEYMENPEKYDAMAETSFRIYVHSPEGELISAETVKNCPFAAEKDLIMGRIATDGEYLIADISGSYEMFRCDGTYIGELTAGEGEEVTSFGRNGAGELVCSVDTGDMLRICTINKSNAEVDTVLGEYDMTGSINDITPAYGEHSMYLRTLTGIFGVRSDNNNIEKLFNMSAARLNASYLTAYCRFSDGSFGFFINEDYIKTKLRRFTACDPSELEDLPVITIAASSSNSSGYVGAVSSYIDQWNDEGHDFVVEIKNYANMSSGEYDPEGISQRIREDALAGDLPDIIYSLGLDGTLEKIDLRTLDVLCDLGEFMDNDEEFTRESIVPAVRRNIETDGKIFILPERFDIDLGYVVKSKYLSDPVDWSVDKYIELLKMEKPDEYYDSKIRRMYNCYWTRWIDYDNASCDFTSDSFVKYLEYCDEADSINTDYSVEAPEMDTIDEFINDEKIVYEYANIGNYTNYISLTRGTFGGEEITFTGSEKEPGKPVMSFETNHGYGITKTCKNKEMAWEFIKSMFDDSVYEQYDDERGFKGAGPFPVTRSGLEAYEAFDRREINYNKYPDIDKYPDFRDYHGYTYSKLYAGWTLGDRKIGSVTAEDAAAVNELIENSVVNNTRGISTPNEIEMIGSEEINRFFAGECTAQQCAEAMQERISTYLSEKYG